MEWWDEIPSGRWPSGISGRPRGVLAIYLIHSRRAYGPYVCFRHSTSGEQAPRPPNTKNSQQHTLPAVIIGCGGDEIRVKLFTLLMQKCSSPCISMQILDFLQYMHIFQGFPHSV